MVLFKSTIHVEASVIVQAHRQFDFSEAQIQQQMLLLGAQL
jgi:hypothetical protein